MRPTVRRLSAVTSVLKDAALARTPATEPTAFSWLDESHAESSKQGALRGRRIAIKENISLKGAPTSCSSSILGGYISPYTAACVESLQSAGASICGQTKMDEFGMGSLTSHLPRDYGPVCNPSGPKGSKELRHAGGSSGGSAVAVADGSCWAALGTDTGGSVRLPASYCGVVGLKPSYGLISRYGVVSYADSLDCVGILANTVEIAQSAFEITSKPDEKDMTCVSAAVRSKAKAATESQLRQLPGHGKSTLQGLRIGIPSQTLLAEPHLTLSEDLLSFLRDQGASFFAVDLPSFSSALPAYYVLASAEASSNLARYGGGFFGQAPESLEGESGEERRRRLRTVGFGEEVKKRLLAGTHALSANAFNNTYLKALHLRRQLRRELDRTFRLANPLRSDATGHPDGVDILLHPTAISTAPRVGEGKADGVDEYAQDVLTVPASLGGLPSMSVPAGRGADGWPVGVSLTSQWGSEDLLFWAGKAVEQWQRDS